MRRKIIQKARKLSCHEKTILRLKSELAALELEAAEMRVPFLNIRRIRRTKDKLRAAERAAGIALRHKLLVEETRALRKARSVAEKKAAKEATKATARIVHNSKDAAVKHLCALTQREREALGRERMLTYNDEFLARQLVEMEGNEVGFSAQVALDVAVERERKISAMPIKMRLTIEKMELAHLRKRIAATTELC